MTPRLGCRTIPVIEPVLASLASCCDPQASKTQHQQLLIRLRRASLRSSTCSRLTLVDIYSRLSPRSSCYRTLCLSLLSRHVSDRQPCKRTQHRTQPSVLAIQVLCASDRSYLSLTANQTAIQPYSQPTNLTTSTKPQRQLTFDLK